MFRLREKGFFMKNNTIEAEIANYTGKLLRDNFGRGPTSVYVSVKEPLITIYLKGFLAPIETVLLGQRNEVKVEETRDLMMKEMIPELKATLRTMAEIEVDGIYYDWDLSRKTGIIFASINSDNPIPENDYSNKDAIHEQINRFSIQAEKEPEEIKSSMANPRTLTIIRKGILVDIEKELIENGYVEELKLSKRRLEKKLLNNNQLTSLVDGQIEDTFVAWDFNLDIAYTIMILKPNSTV